MKERPILFSTPMVRAISDGKKTMTRRVVKNQPPINYLFVKTLISKNFLWAKFCDPLREIAEGDEKHWVKCPYGQVGDRLWVRETFFMPRCASRIILEIIGIRVERLQEITEEDAISEGVDRTNTSIHGYAKERFEKLWDSINGKKYPWSSNPWVWVIEFKE
ncbi:MAG: hypothetical protein WBK67_02060 [Minisyncoccales bacterium]